MRVAVVIGSGYEKNGQLPELPSATLDCDLMDRRLSDRDAGFRVLRFDAERGLAEQLEQTLLAEPGPIEDLLIYFTGYCVLSAERGPGLLLDGERLGTFSLPRLRKVLEYFARRACLIVDAAAVIEGPHGPEHVVSAFGEALTHGSNAVSVLVAARRSDKPDSFGGSAFTGLVLMALDWLASSREPSQAVDVRWLFEAIRADEKLFAAVPAAALYPEEPSFELLPGRASAELPRFESELDAEERTPPRAQSSGSLPAFERAVPLPNADAIYDTLFGVEPAADAPLPSFADFSEEAGPAEVLPAEPIAQELPVLEPPPPKWPPGHAPEPPDEPAEPAAPELALEIQNVELHESLIDRHLASGQPRLALARCAPAARIAPTRASVYRRAFQAFEALGDLDGAWNATCVLDALGEAEINEALLASQHKPEGLLAARGSLTYAEWQTTLLAEHRDPLVWDVLEALGVVGVRAGAGYAKQQKRYTELDPDQMQDPEKSTAMLAKTLGWTARLLGLSAPALYVVPELGPTLEAASTEAPSVLAGRELSSGLTLSQLAFLWGRQLPRFRNEVRALAFFKTPAELALLLAAALALGEAPGALVRSLGGDEKRLYAALRREVRGPSFDRLRGVARDFPSSEVPARATHMLRGLELIGVRAGLVACGDVALAAELIRRFPSGSLTSVEDQLGELFAFAISEPYAALRRRIGVAIAA